MAEYQTCKDNGILDLLPWYVTRKLTQAEQDRVSQHIKTCTSCSEEVAKIKVLAEKFQLLQIKNYKSHINSILLTLYSENKKSLAREIITRIEDHLVQCNSCKQEYDKLTIINQSLKVESKWFHLKNILNRTESSISKWFLRPAFVYAFVLLLLYPAWLGISDIRNKENAVNKPKSISKHFTLEPIDQRAIGNSYNTFVINNSDDLFTISFAIPGFDPKPTDYSAFITDEKNIKIWELDKLSFVDSYGSLMIVCNQKHFTDGIIYYLNVKEKGANEDDSQGLYKFVFKLVKNE